MLREEDGPIVATIDISNIMRGREVKRVRLSKNDIANFSTTKKYVFMSDMEGHFIIDLLGTNEKFKAGNRRLVHGEEGRFSTQKDVKGPTMFKEGERYFLEVRAFKESFTFISEDKGPVVEVILLLQSF